MAGAGTSWEAANDLGVVKLGYAGDEIGSDFEHCDVSRLPR